MSEEVIDSDVKRSEYFRNYRKKQYKENSESIRLMQLVEYYASHNRLPKPTSKLISMCKERDLDPETLINQKKKRNADLEKKKRTTQ